MPEPTPPRWLERVVALSLSPSERNAVLGDLHEEYIAILRRDGPRDARRWYTSQTLRSLFPNLTRRLSRRAKAADTAFLDDVGSRSLWGRSMHAFWQDVRFGWRMIRRRPLVSLVALGSIVVGLSLSAIVFNLLDAAVLRSLPVADPDRLAVALIRRGPNFAHNFSYPDFVDYRAGQQSFVDLAAYTRTTVSVQTPAGSELVEAELVSDGYFATFRPRLRAGRGLSEVDATASAVPAIVVSDGLWRRLNGDADTFTPRALVVNTRAFTIVGVAASEFHGLDVGRDVRLWAGLQDQPILDPAGGRRSLTERTSSGLTMIGRLRPSIDLQTAEADLNRVEAAIAAVHPRSSPRVIALVPGARGDSMMPGAVANPLSLLLGATLLVLAVAGANVANVLASRAIERGREIAVRVALGAGRLRLARLVIVETVLLAGIAAAVSVAISIVGARLAVPWLSSFGEDVRLDIGLDWRTAGFVAVAAVVTAVTASVAPMLQIASVAPAGTLGSATRTIAPGRVATRLHRGLVVSQFALSLTLVAVATLLTRTLVNLKTLPTGFDADHVALVAVKPEAAQFDARRVRQYVQDVEASLAAVPGVRAAGYGRIIPVGFGGSRTSIVVPGYQPAADEDMGINFNVVSPSYFEATGIRLVAGRPFSDADRPGTPVVAIVNATMAERYWPGQHAVGGHFKFDGDNAPAVEVVGVAADVKYREMREAAGPSFYLSLTQETRPRDGIIHVRTASSPAPLLEHLRRAAAATDASVPVAEVRTLASQVDRNLATDRLVMSIGGALGLAALGLAAVGLFGMMATLVGQRTREVGIRIALGARPADVMRQVLADGVRIALAGSVIGLTATLWAGRLIRERLFGIASTDPASLIASVALLCGVALVAVWLPAHRAARVDPAGALHAD